MGDLSEHFECNEFACKCGCGFRRVDGRLIEALEALRRVFDRPIHVTSGCRCAPHNRSIGGAAGSQHTVGRAADIQIPGVSPQTVGWVARAVVPEFRGIKVYSTWTHLDVRQGAAWLQGF